MQDSNRKLVVGIAALVYAISMAMAMALGWSLASEEPKARRHVLSDVLPQMSRRRSNDVAGSKTAIKSHVQRYPDLFTSIAGKVLPSVVSISTIKISPKGALDQLFLPDSELMWPNGSRRKSKSRSRKFQEMGSGVIVSPDGMILTNDHVVADAIDIRVTFADRREMEAKVVGTDSGSDLTVLKVRQKVMRLRPFRFGDSDRMRLGDLVLAVGNQFGMGQTVTMGIVSAKGRTDVGILDHEDFIQTDAAINPGSSGGALVSLRGELVGINTAILSHSGGHQGVGLAIPSNMARPIMASLIKHGRFDRGWMGIEIQTMTKELAAALRLTGFSGREGVLISDVLVKSPADKAHLARNDVILKLNGRCTKTAGRLRSILALLGPKSRVVVEYWRLGRIKRGTVILGKRAAPRVVASRPEEKIRTVPNDRNDVTVEGLSVEIRNRYKIPTKINKGVLVTRVELGSKAMLAGLLEGDVILQLNHKNVDSPKTFTRLFKRASKTALLLVRRRNGVLYLVIPRG